MCISTHTLDVSKVHCFALAQVVHEDVLLVGADANPLVARENVVVMSCLACLQDPCIR